MDTAVFIWPSSEETQAIIDTLVKKIVIDNSGHITITIAVSGDIDDTIDRGSYSTCERLPLHHEQASMNGSFFYA